MRLSECTVCLSILIYSIICTAYSSTLTLLISLLQSQFVLFLKIGADINAQTEETQETALTLACCGGFLEVADFLLRSGALIELGCSTPLMEAAQEGHIELVSFLLQNGDFFFLIDNDSKTLNPITIVFF